MFNSKNSSKQTFGMLFLLVIGVILILPVATTLNELLTRIIENSGLYRPVKELFVPYMSRLVYVVLRKLPGLQIGIFSHGVVVNGTLVYITWNCLGWQSFLLFFASLIFGLKHNYTLRSKIETILFGFFGTLLVNLIRLTFTAALIGWWSGLFKVLFHNYFASLITLVWLFFFWWFTYKFILEEKIKIS